MALGPGNGGVSPPPSQPARRRRIQAAFLNRPPTGMAVKASGFGPAPSGQNRPNPALSPRWKMPTVPYKDNAYFNDLSALQRNRETANNALEAQKQQTDISYGFNTDPATNPYSRAALLQRSYNNAQKGTNNSMAAAGQLYSGAHSNARTGNTLNYESNLDATRKAYDAELDRIRSAKATANADYNTGVVRAEQSAINRAYKDRPTGQTSAIKPPRRNAGRNRR